MNFVRRRSETTEIGVGRFIGWRGVTASSFTTGGGATDETASSHGGMMNPVQGRLISLLGAELAMLEEMPSIADRLPWT